jgi:hypothetical protein
MAHRIFERMDPERANLIAQRLGRTLPKQRDYSLAEIFNDSTPIPTKQKTLGFH